MQESTRSSILHGKWLHVDPELTTPATAAGARVELAAFSRLLVVPLMEPAASVVVLAPSAGIVVEDPLAELSAVVTDVVAAADDPVELVVEVFVDVVTSLVLIVLTMVVVMVVVRVVVMVVVMVVVIAVAAWSAVIFAYPSELEPALGDPCSRKYTSGCGDLR